MKNSLFVLATVSALCACSKVEQHRTSQSILLDTLSHDSAVEVLVTSKDTPMIEPKTQPDRVIPTTSPAEHKAYRKYEGLKSFDKRYQYNVDTLYRNMKQKMHINDSLIAAKRRELQIEDSLKRLK